MLKKEEDLSFKEQEKNKLLEKEQKLKEHEKNNIEKK